MTARRCTSLAESLALATQFGGQGCKAYMADGAMGKVVRLLLPHGTPQERAREIEARWQSQELLLPLLVVACVHEDGSDPFARDKGAPEPGTGYYQTK